MKCRKCKAVAVKNGKQSSGRQRYYCSSCKHSFQRSYRYNACNHKVDNKIFLLQNESVGICGISRLLRISKSTVLKRIRSKGLVIKKPIFKETQQYYEVDEMRVVVSNKETQAWVTYAINRHTKKIVDFVVGRRTRDNISRVVSSVLELNPKQIATDRLITHECLIPKGLHETRKSSTTVIEGHNLTLRTRLKRLSRKTICFSKSMEMLEATLKIYFWGDQSFSSCTD